MTVPRTSNRQQLENNDGSNGYESSVFLVELTVRNALNRQNSPSPCPRSGGMVKAEPKAVLGVIIALPHLLLHKSALGMADWAATEALLISALVRGLFEAEAIETHSERGET